MRTIAQQVERSTHEQSNGSRQLKQAIENINGMVGQLNNAHRSLHRGSERAVSSVSQVEDAARRQDAALRELVTHVERIKKTVN
jgi:methyl-accepting chemotaxis protein